ncbi:MAG: phoA [Candidatus Adlerbacteria bacterium]|nr:phoA [Candidatus Adlerbacteria bacterium]
MDEIVQPPLTVQDKLWQWFVRHAESKHALVWLAAVAFFDTIFFPVAPEIFLVALIVAHPRRWAVYLTICIVFSVLGAAAGYWLAHYLFVQFGPWLLNTPAMQAAFESARHLLHGRVFTTMAFATFTPLPDKIFIYAAGFLGVGFIPYLLGYFVGRGIRMAVTTYLTVRFGKKFIDVVNEYSLIAGAVFLVALVVYVIVHVHPFGW